MTLCGERQEFLESVEPVQTRQRTTGDLQKDVERLGYTWQPIEKGRRLRTVEVPLSAACTLEAVIGDRQRERSTFISHTDSQTCFLSSRMACSVATGTIQDAHRQCHFYKSAKDWTLNGFNAPLILNNMKLYCGHLTFRGDDLLYKWRLLKKKKKRWRDKTQRGTAYKNVKLFSPFNTLLLSEGQRLSKEPL